MRHADIMRIHLLHFYGQWVLTAHTNSYTTAKTSLVDDYIAVSSILVAGDTIEVDSYDEVTNYII